MRIAVLTLPLHRNYGGVLQAYALQTYLEKMGHEVIVINRRHSPNLSLPLLLLRVGSMMKSLFRRVVLGKKEYIIMSPLSRNFRSKWDGYDILPFVDESIHLTKVLNSSRKLRRYLERGNFDCLAVGSDQVWRPRYSPCITDYFFKEVAATKTFKIAYAASFGTDEWEFNEEETRECAELAKKFDRISVREKSGIGLCAKYLGVEAYHVLDPTMLLESDDYIRLFENAETSKSDTNVFCYVLDSNAESEKIIKSLEQDGYNTFCVEMKVTPTVNNPRPCQLSVEEWLRGIHDSKLVVTDSFHVCVFSIIFKKPFIALGNESRGNARFDSLLEAFGLQDRLVLNYEAFIENKELLMRVFDTEGIESLLQHQREYSMSFLTDILNAKG